MERTKKIYYLDALRALMTAAIVILHVAGSMWASLDPRSFDWNVLNAVNGLMRPALPIFFMISGALLLDPEREFTYRGLWREKIFRIVTTFAFWSCIYALIKMLQDGSAASQSFLGGFLYEAADGHYHLWFLYAIIGLYIVLPFLRRIASNPDMMRYFIILAFVFGFVVPFILKFDAKPLAVSILSKLNINMVLGWSGYFMLGYYLRTENIPLASRRVLYVGGALAALSIPLCTALFSLSYEMPCDEFLSYINPACAVASAALFVAVKRRCEFVRPAPPAAYIVKTVSGASLGIYLTQVLFLELLRALGIGVTSFSPLLSIPLFSAIIFALSLALTLLMRKSKLLDKYVI